MEWNRDGARHLLMRLGLGFVLAWFGIHELHNPGEWSVFAPSFVASISPISINDLILLHGFLLLLAAVAVVLGLFFVPGSVLAAGLMGEIVFGLWYDGGISDLVIRDIGLMGLAAALALDPSRFWHLENVLAASAAARSDRRRAEREGRTAWGGSGTASVIASAAVMLGLVSVASLVLYGSGNGTAAPGNGELTLATSSPAPAATAAPSGPVPATSATPAPSASATSTVFDAWRYKQYSYQIYPGQPSSDAQKALAGFQVSIQDQGSSVLVQLKATSSRYQDASFTVDKANTAYFVETSMRDDDSDQEQNLGDDGVVVVNPQGYLLNS